VKETIWAGKTNEFFENGFVRAQVLKHFNHSGEKTHAKKLRFLLRSFAVFCFSVFKTLAAEKTGRSGTAFKPGFRNVPPNTVQMQNLLLSPPTAPAAPR